MIRCQIRQYEKFRTASTTSGWKSQSVKLFQRNSSGERRLKLIGEQIEEDSREAERTSLSTARLTSSRQRPQTCTEAPTKHYNYTVNETGEEREHRLLTLQRSTRRSCPTPEVNSQNYLLQCSDRQQELYDLYNARQEYLSNGLRTADQPLHYEQQWVLQ